MKHAMWVSQYVFHVLHLSHFRNEMGGIARMRLRRSRSSFVTSSFHYYKVTLPPRQSARLYSTKARRERRCKRRGSRNSNMANITWPRERFDRRMQQYVLQGLFCRPSFHSSLFFFHPQAARLQAALERSARNLQASRKEKLGDRSLTPGTRS